MFKLPENFFKPDENGCGLPPEWCRRGQKNEYYLSQVGYGSMETVTLRGAVYYLCQLIKSHKAQEFSYLPIGICKYICDEGCCEPAEGAEPMWFQTEEEFYNWVEKTFEIRG